MEIVINDQLIGNSHVFLSHIAMINCTVAYYTLSNSILAADCVIGRFYGGDNLFIGSGLRDCLIDVGEYEFERITIFISCDYDYTDLVRFTQPMEF